MSWIGTRRGGPVKSTCHQRVAACLTLFPRRELYLSPGVKLDEEEKKIQNQKKRRRHPIPTNKAALHGRRRGEHYCTLGAEKRRRSSVDGQHPPHLTACLSLTPS